MSHRITLSDILRDDGSLIKNNAERNLKNNKKIKKILDGNPKNLVVLADGFETINFLKENKILVDLIYIDPPFNTGKTFGIEIDAGDEKIYKDCYEDNLDKDEFLLWMYEILTRLKNLLKETGSIFLHVDYRTSSELKLIMDKVFGDSNFVNEIIWSYKSGGAGKKSFSKKHDNILFYSKDYRQKIFKPLKEKSYNRDFKPYNFKGVKEYKDHLGYYTMVNMKDVWNIDMVGRTSSERVKYPSQKPFELLRRIIESTTEEGMTVLDIFGGSGSTAKAASILKRHYIHGDISEYSCSVAREYLEDATYFSNRKFEFRSEFIDGEFTCEIENGGELKRAYVKKIMVSVDGIQFQDFKEYSEINKAKYNYIYLENIFGKFKVIEVRK
ncbi:DNA (cytosine-5-)-methyltransferase [Peptoniphilus duerdenii ATCC BAA-1640]|uniref:DNA (Cytosine-5-)-methyltransferase n=1 Tax=Peptoniphilus duerdenii ATCC BAA-1640 TaxID=862517 RepID=E0NLC9_9FIRM|nr:site-specific DNA-methyltransferase [Peptoniphilus duerdenii]EFM25405.1 DNA (cytosine-5-)-methyltransferase [Peptoniphilus duerdenii ATCC BAA-1640]